MPEKRKAKGGGGGRPRRGRPLRQFKSREQVTWDVVREIALALPGMADAVSYGTPSLKVQGRFLARLREDGASVALRIGFLERQELMEADPEAFFITDHYLNYPAVLVRLAKARRSLLAPILVAAWRRVAPKRMVAGFEAAKARA